MLEEYTFGLSPNPVKNGYRIFDDERRDFCVCNTCSNSLMFSDLYDNPIGEEMDRADAHSPAMGGRRMQGNPARADIGRRTCLIYGGGRSGRHAHRSETHGGQHSAGGARSLPRGACRRTFHRMSAG